MRNPTQSGSHTGERGLPCDFKVLAGAQKTCAGLIGQGAKALLDGDAQNGGLGLLAQLLLDRAAVTALDHDALRQLGFTGACLV